MRFKKVIMVLVLGLIFASSAWGQPANWAVFVPTREQYVGSSADSIGNFWGGPYDLSGVDHIGWFAAGLVIYALMIVRLLINTTFWVTIMTVRGISLRWMLSSQEAGTSFGKRGPFYRVALVDTGAVLLAYAKLGTPQMWSAGSTLT